jgi:hypothetical protein
MKAILLIVPPVLLLVAADAQTRAYDNPKVNEYAVDNCLYFGKVCGKPAADAFCDRKGYREATHYRTASARPTMVLGEDKVCDEDYCVALVDVVCVGTSTSGDFKRLDTEFPLESNTDRYGSDYHDFALKEARPELCRRACLLDSTCKAFTYTKPGAAGRGDTPWCYLKDGAPRPTKDDCCVSGVKK